MSSAARSSGTDHRLDHAARVGLGAGGRHDVAGQQHVDVRPPRPSCRKERASASLSSSTSERPMLAALGLEEGVGHGAADQQLVDALEQVLEHADLVGHLGAADDGDEGALDVAEQLAEELHLALHQQAHALVGDELGDAHRRGVGPVRGAERIVDVDVRVAGQRRARRPRRWLLRPARSAGSRAARRCRRAGRRPPCARRRRPARR